MKVLITGAKGQLGKALLASAPADMVVTALDRHGLDITNQEAIDAAMAEVLPDCVINAAAYTAVDKAEEDPESAHAANALAPGLLASSAAFYGARFVHISTDFVFDGRQSHPYATDDVTAPLGVYGLTKRVGEQATVLAHPEALIVRTAWVYSEHSGNFVQTMLRLMRERDEIRVVSDQIGTPTFATHLAQSIWSLLGKGAKGIFHYTDAGVASWYDFAVAIQEEARALGLLDRMIAVLPIATADYPTPALRPAYSVLDKTKTTQLIGAAPHWRDGLRTMLNRQRENGNG
jgi:dTDP-4-dehydrorhamnose reductase